MFSWPHVLGQNIVIVGACGRGESSPHGRQEKRKQEGVRSKTVLPVTYFLQPDPTSQKSIQMLNPLTFDLNTLNHMI
jgi:hypothetical protein